LRDDFPPLGAWGAPPAWNSRFCAPRAAVVVGAVCCKFCVTQAPIGSRRRLRGV